MAPSTRIAARAPARGHVNIYTRHEPLDHIAVATNGVAAFTGQHVPRLWAGVIPPQLIAFARFCAEPIWELLRARAEEIAHGRI